MAAAVAEDIAPVRMTGIAPLPGNGFRALYADGQEVRMRGPAAQSEPDEDPLEQIRAEAFAQGFEAGSRTTVESMGNDSEARARLVDALEQLGPASSGTLATMLSAAVVRLVGQIVGEVEIDADLLCRRCEAVAALVDETEGKGALRLNPDDLTLIVGADIGVQVVADPQMRRGSVRLDTADGWIEDGPDVRLSRLKALLDDMEGRL
jgi:flagellar assembly protein FliH